MKPKAHRIPEAHSLVAAFALDFANDLYEQWARDNRFYKRFPEGRGRKVFVEYVAPQFLPEARATLAGMLTADYPDEFKARVYEALQLDNTLTRGRISRADAKKAVASAMADA